MSGSDRFSARAAAWDGNPFVHIMSDRAWETIQATVPTFNEADTDRPNVLEIGCGTGLLSLQVAPKAGRLVAVDTAEGMIAALKMKLEKPEAPRNITPIHALLEDPEDSLLPPADLDSPNGPRMKFDLITSHLVLHHIPDLEAVLKTMLGCLVEGGRVALTDFEDFGPEARRFHPESKMDGVERHGINRAWMEDLMRKVGFVDVDVQVGWTANKTVEKFPGEFGDKANAADPKQGTTMQFPFLICMGCRKPAAT
ncbi:S-adenosyl-L-methionine-dependent methyltransferase [Xylariaceae sp. FL0016]|nr:S-adenosyl-L-methionine-dependent methyltransferase [Xylariaceae sp. FL0016]